MNRKYIDIPFEIKAKDITEEGTFIGYGSTFGGNPDSYGDVIIEGAFSETLSKGGRNGTGIAMLWQHDSKQPIGIWTELVENKKGLKVSGKLALETQVGHDAYVLMKMGALKGLSIGWDIMRDNKGNPADGAIEYDEKKRIRFLKRLSLWEISPVTFPANIRAKVTNVKTAVENAKTERELEFAFREECNISSSAAKYLVSLCKDKLIAGSNELVEEIKKEEPLNKQKETLNNLLGDLLSVSNLTVNRCKKVIPYKPYTKVPENVRWNGPAEIRKATVKDLKEMATWYDLENEDIKTSYKLPHHRQSDYAVVWNGVKAAMGALLGARGGVDIPANEKRGVYNHLRRHYIQFDKDVPEFKE